MNPKNIKMAGKTHIDHLLQIKNIINELPNIFMQNNKEPLTLRDIYNKMSKKYYVDLRVLSVVIDTLAITKTNINGKKICVKSFSGRKIYWMV